MVDANDNDEADVAQAVITPSDIISTPDMNSKKTVVAFEVTGNMEENEDEDEEEYEEEEDEEDEYEDEYEDSEEAEDEEAEEKVIDGLDTDKEREKGKAVVEVTNKENAAREDEKKAEVPKSGDELGENSKSIGKRPRPRNRNKKKDEQNVLAANGEKPESSSKTKGEQKVPKTLAANGDKPESSSKKKGSKRVESMGMVFMCTSKTKTDCFRYKVLGLPGNKKDQVAKIYKGMRLFLFDVDLRLMYGIFKAAGPGGYNLEPKAFKSDFPSQVRFTVLDDCLPLAEENFKGVLKENYYSRNKFEGLLKADQVKKLCKLFVEMGRGGARPKAPPKPRRTRPVENHRIRPVEIRRSRAVDSHSSRPRETRKRREREEERRPRSPPHREKRRYTDYERPPVLYEHEPPVLYEREPPVPRYLPPPRPPPPAMASPVRLYTYERPLDIPPYVHDRVPEHHTYRVHNVEPRDRERERDRDPYHVYSREAPSYRDPMYTLPPEYHLSRDYHPPQVPTPEYRLSGGSTRAPSYREVGHPSDYRSSAAQLPEYRSRTHYRY